MPPPRDYLQYDAANSPVRILAGPHAWKQAFSQWEAIRTRTRPSGGGNDLDSVKPFTANQTNIRMSSVSRYASNSPSTSAPPIRFVLRGEGTTLFQGGPTA